jgi:hypothetical protein
LFSYLVVEVGRVGARARFFSFAIAPLLILSCAGLVAVGAAIARIRPLRPAVGLVAAAAYIFVLGKADGLSKIAARSLDPYDTAASVIQGADIKPVVSNLGWGARRYLPPGSIATDTSTRLEALFCSKQTPFIYFEDDIHNQPSTACLAQRGAIRIPIENRRLNPMAVWLVTSPGSRGATSATSSQVQISASPSSVPATGPARGQTTITWSAPAYRSVTLHVSVDGGPGIRMAAGGTRGQAVARFISKGHSYVFSLYSAGPKPKLLGQVTVSRPR